MPNGPQRGYSDSLTNRQIQNMNEAAAFADEIGYPLNLCIDINWTRTWLGDDPDGQVLDRLMESSRKWLKPRYVPVFAQIEVRECPHGCSNAHILVHCPSPRIPAFKQHVRSVLTDACRRLDKGAVVFRLVGSGNPTAKAALGKLLYLSKGADPDTAEHFNIDRSPQGRIYGKRISVSQDISRSARQRHIDGAAQAILVADLQEHRQGAGAAKCGVLMQDANAGC
jgi:hypothetical protein